MFAECSADAGKSLKHTENFRYGILCKVEPDQGLRPPEKVDPGLLEKVDLISKFAL